MTITANFICSRCHRPVERVSIHEAEGVVVWCHGKMETITPEELSDIMLVGGESLVFGRHEAA